MYTNNDINVATKSMSLKRSYGGVQIIATVWKGYVLLINWDKLNEAIISNPLPAYLNAELAEEDKLVLTKLIKDYLSDPKVK